MSHSGLCTLAAHGHCEVQRGCTHLSAIAQTSTTRQHVKKDHPAKKENYPDFFTKTTTFEVKYVLRTYKNRSLNTLMFFAEDWTSPPVQAQVLQAPIPIYRSHAQLSPGAQFLQTLRIWSLRLVRCALRLSEEWQRMVGRASPPSTGCLSVQVRVFPRKKAFIMCSIVGQKGRCRRCVVIVTGTASYPCIALSSDE